MYGHDTHQIIRFALEFCGRGFCFCRLHVLHKANKMEQPFSAVIFIRFRFFQQKPQVCLPQTAAGCHACIIIISCLLIEIPQQFTKGQFLRCFPPIQQVPLEAFQFFQNSFFRPLCKIPQDTFIKQSIAAKKTDFRQSIGTDVIQGRMEHRKQGNILIGIVNKAEEIQNGVNFRHIKVSFCRFRIIRNAFFTENVIQRGTPTADTPHQNCHIPIFHGTIAFQSSVIDLIASLHHFSDFPGNHGSFHLPFIQFFQIGQLLFCLFR